MSYFRMLAIALMLAGCSTAGDYLDKGIRACCDDGPMACDAVISQLNAAIDPNEIHVHCAAVPAPP